MKQKNKKIISKSEYRKYIILMINMIKSKEELKRIYNYTSESLNRDF